MLLPDKHGGDIAVRKKLPNFYEISVDHYFIQFNPIMTETHLNIYALDGHPNDDTYDKSVDVSVPFILILFTVITLTTKNSASLAICEGIPLMTGSFPHIRPVVRKVFPTHDITMETFFFVCSYFAFCLYIFCRMIFELFGDKQQMAERLQDQIVPTRSPPCCCCLVCLPTPKLTRYLDTVKPVYNDHL